MKINLTIVIERYIAHPYWPEREKLIQITKESGMNRARGTANRRKSLEEYLRSTGMTLAEFDALEKSADRQFYMSDQGQIIIPKHQWDGFMVCTCDTLRAAQRPCASSSVRSRIRATDLVSERTERDGVWSRFAVVSAGTGQKLSNQRALRENDYLDNAEFRGVLTIDEQFVRPDVLRNAIELGGREIGIGASRKMGMGRFEVTDWSAQ